MKVKQDHNDEGNYTFLNDKEGNQEALYVEVEVCFRCRKGLFQKELAHFGWFS